MKCPKCRCEEFSDSGMCLWCGYQMKGAAAKPPNEPSAADLDLKTPDTIHQESKTPVEDEMSGQHEYPNERSETDGLFGPSLNIDDRGKDWRILLFRTLSGLMDLFIVTFSAGVFIVAADFFSGISILDAASLLHFFALFTLMYFLYSFYFLGLSKQTIGMMIVHLYLVTSKDNSSPQTLRVFIRCGCYFISLICLGIGLIWALFDKEGLCLHDRITNTHVVWASNQAPRNAIHYS
jgi:uncharacterized RDD family membrane protein YckC